MNTDYVTYGDLGALGLDLTNLISSVTGGVTQVQSAIDAPRIARQQAAAAASNAAAANAAAAAEQARLAAIIAGNAPHPIDWTKLALYAGIAVVGSVVVIKGLRMMKRGRK